MTKKHISIALIIGTLCIVIGTSLLFVFKVPEALAYTSLYVYKSTDSPSSITVYTTFGPVPVYKLYGSNYNGWDTTSITAVAVTPNSTTIDDSNVTLAFYNDVDGNNEVSAGDVNLGAVEHLRLTIQKPHLHLLRL